MCERPCTFGIFFKRTFEGNQDNDLNLYEICLFVVGATKFVDFPKTKANIFEIQNTWKRGNNCNSKSHNYLTYEPNVNFKINFSISILD